MKKVTGIAVVVRPEGTRLSINYCVLDDDGKVISDNNRVNRVIMDEDILAAYATINNYAQEIIDSEESLYEN